MLFDEMERKKLIKTYQALPEDEQKAFRILSVIFVSVQATDFTVMLNEYETRQPSGSRPAPKNKSDKSERWHVQKNVLPMLQRWTRAQLAEKDSLAQGVKWTCNRLLQEVPTREALEKGEFGAINAVAEKLLGVAYMEKMNRYDSVSLYLRSARKFLYLGETDAYEKSLGADVNHWRKDRYNALGNINPIIEILANPVDIGLLLSMPPRLDARVFRQILALSFGDAARFCEVRKALDAQAEKHPDNEALAVLRAEYLMMSGHPDEAVRLVTGTRLITGFALRAMGALLRGDREAALARYEEGLKELRKASGKRKIGYSSWTGVFYPLLLLAKQGEGKKIKDYIDGAVHVAGTEYPDTLILIRFLCDPGAKREEFYTFATVLQNKPQHSFLIFFYVLYGYWLDADRTRELLPLAESAYRCFALLGLDFFAAELSVLIREFSPRTADKYRDFAPTPFPLKDLILRQTEWERSLSALSGIGGKNAAAVTAKGSKRFVWQLSWTSRNKTPLHITVTPMEQTLQNSGWSKGKNVALKRLYRKADTVASMSDQDHRAASAVREEHNYYDTSYTVDAPQALEALVGHPYLFRESDGSRIEVVADEPQLAAVSKGDFFLLKLSPFPKDNTAVQRVVREDGPNCLRVTRFEERHVKMALILGEKGLKVPNGAKDALLKALGSLASVVTIHSDIEGVEANAEQVETDGRVYVQIQPSGEGLDVDMVVRPLGPDSTPCRPGSGGGNIFGLMHGKRVQTRRSLDRERDAFMTAQRACPALAEAEQLADEKWYLPEPELALEFLMQVQELGDGVVLEWPKGQTMRVKSQISMSSMNVTVRNTQDWFALSGEIKIDEDLVLGMKDMMELLKAGYGRFLPLGDGQFVALTKEFRRRLEVLSSLGDQRGDELRVSPLATGLLAPLVDEAASFKGSPEWKRQLTRINESAELTPELPSTFRGELRSYQLEGFQWLSRLAHWNAGACLADDMGLGKTIQALALLVARGNDGPALIVAPTSVCSNWLSEAARFAPTLNMKELRYGDREETLTGLEALDVVVTTYGLLQNEIERLGAICWRTIVLDEAQAIKNMGTKRSAAAMKLQGDFRMVTTGTPIENRLSELWNLFRFLNPHFLGSLESFNRRFATPIERDGDKEAKARLKRVIQPFILRRNKEQVLQELPSKTEITLRVEMKEEEQAVYEALRRNAIEDLSLNKAADQRFQIFAQLMRLRRACCNASLVVPEKDFPSAKLEAFAEILEELRGSNHKALVFSQFVDHLSILRKYLDGEGIPYQYLDGSTPPHERAKRVKAFQAGEGDCFLISLKAGGTGLNLTAADYVLHMDPWWNPAVEEQASDRAHRIGQERPVTVYRIVTKGTIEEKIVDLHTWKRDLAESLLDEAEAPLRLSAQEMLDLIRDAR